MEPITGGYGDDLPTAVARRRLFSYLPLAYSAPMAPSWVVSVERGDLLRKGSLFDLSGLERRFVDMFFSASVEGEYSILFGANKVSFKMYGIFLRPSSLFCMGQSTFGGAVREVSVTVPPEVSTDVSALQSVLFWVCTGRLMDIRDQNAEELMQHQTLPPIGYLGDLLEVYKIAKFLEIEQLSSALLEDAVDIFTDQSVDTDVQCQLGGLLRASQKTDGVVDWLPLYTAVCTILANKYLGVAVLTTHPFAYTRQTWEVLWDLCATQLSIWGDTVDLFFLLFETPEVQLTQNHNPCNPPSVNPKQQRYSQQEKMPLIIMKLARKSLGDSMVGGELLPRIWRTAPAYTFEPNLAVKSGLSKST
jgi:hypothetical protein